MAEYYILKGHKPVAIASAREWAKHFERDNRQVASDTLGDIRISTVFLGLNHAFGGGPPVLFETLVVGGPLADEMERYSTWEKAEVGHRRMVDRVRATLAGKGE